MKQLYREFISPLRSGTRSLLALFAIVYFAQLIGEKTGTYNLTAWCALNPPSVWSGQVWRLTTYAFIAPIPATFVMNLLAIGILGTWLERVWSAREWWFYCLLCAAGTGVVKVLITPHSPASLTGNVGMTFGLLVAWGRMFAHEEVQFMGMGKMTLGTVALILGVINLLVVVPTSGWLDALVLASGGAIGWLYLSLAWKLANNRSCRPLNSTRISRLEL